MENQEKLEKLLARMDDMESRMVEFQKKITAIPALSPINGGEGEWDRAMSIKEFLLENNIANIQQIDAPDSGAKNGKRPNLVARIKGKSSQKTVWLMAHMDVVPEGDSKLWETNPWDAIVKNGRIYGRGTEDNQQGLTSSIFTAIALVEAGIKPEYDLGLVLVADEETGSGMGLDFVLKEHPKLFKKTDIIIVPDAGEPDGSMIEVAEKSILWIKFITKGKQCHGSLPGQGINAFRAASDLVVRLNRLYDIFNVKDEVFLPPISTFEPTKKEANVPNVNTIPGEDVFYLDCRILPTYSLEEVFKEIQKLCREIESEYGVKIEFTTTQIVQAPPATPRDSEVVKKLEQAVKQIYNVDAKPMGIGGGTVAAIFRKVGLPVAVWCTLDDVCHQPNEYTIISNMVNDAKVFIHVCLQK